MKKSRFSDEQIIGFLRQAEAGMGIPELCRSGGFSQATFYKWRAKFGGMQVSEAQRLRELESENAKLKKLLAEAHLLGETGYYASLGQVASGFVQCGLQHHVVLEQFQDGIAVAERLVEGPDFDRLGVPEVGTDDVQQGVAQLVGYDGCGLAGEDHLPGDGVFDVEEL